KLLFLEFSTFYGVAQLGLAENLSYSLRKHTGGSARHVSNARLALTDADPADVALRGRLLHQTVRWLGIPLLHAPLWRLHPRLARMLVPTVFEIVMIARKQHMKAALTYAGSDLARSLLFIVPAIGFRSVGGVLAGAVIFAALRLVAMLVYLGREFGRGFRPDYA